MKLYRAISQEEKDDYDLHQQLRTAQNTLEAKQFFKSRTAIKQFVASAQTKDYDPPYLHLLILDIDEDQLENSNPEHMSLDGFEAITIQEGNLVSFNNCINFVLQEDL